MTWQTWWLFVVTEAVLSLTPGPAVLLVLSQALSFGAARSVWSSCGILAANAFYFALSATGLGAILLASYNVFFAIKWIGAAYLIYLGVRAILDRGTPLVIMAAQAAPSNRGRVFADGFVLQVANPKALLFFTALLPQFIDARHPVAVQVAILGVSSIVVEFFILLAYGVVAGQASRYARHPRFATVTNRLSGALLIGAGAGIAALRRD